MTGEEKVILCEYAPGEGRRGWKLGAAGTAVVMAVAVFLLGRFMHSKDGPFLYVVSGHLFTPGFDPIHVGTALDQPTIGKWYFWSTVFSGMTLSYVAAARWLSARRTRAEYWAFAIPAIALCAYLLILLTVPFYWLVQYIHAMGFTPARIRGLAYGLGGYAVLLGFFWWALRRPGRQGRPRGRDKAVPSDEA